MNNYDFSTLINRKKTSATKWNVKKGFIPLTIADMDFLTCPEVTKELIKRIKKGALGYTDVDDSFYSSYISFFKDYYNFEIDKSSLIFSLGVVPTISSSVRALTSIGDKVVITPPTYNIFYNSIVNNKRIPYEVELIKNNNEYYIDFNKLEEAFKDEKTKLFILCNPINPVGKIINKDELDKIGQLAKKYDVIVLSDEIHGLITRNGYKYIPYNNVNEDNKNNSVICLSPTKAFNLAGIHTSAIVINNEEIRKKVVRQINTDEVAEPNVLSIIAASAAFNLGRNYLDKLNEFLFDNKDYAFNFIKDNIPLIELNNSNATYLLWLDISKISKDSDLFASYLEKRHKLLVQSGTIYGKGGQGFIRINVATTRENLIIALKRLKEGVESFLLHNK